jgi:Acyl-CoA reductase (LuxC)
MSDWITLRSELLRDRPEPFERAELAHLAEFLGRLPKPPLGRPRSPIAVSLPNNVSLLGPLVVALLSLLGPELHLKPGSRSRDLTSAFVAWARDRVPAGALRDWLHDRVNLSDELSEAGARAAVRIAFGSDEALRAISALPHRDDSYWFGFGDRASEAWLEPAAADDDALRALVRTFAVYGRAGCTSPRRAVLLEASPAEAYELRERLARLWPAVEGTRCEMHVASQTALAAQLAAAAGVPATRTLGGGALLSAEETDGVRTLAVVAASLEEAVVSAPANLQTIGHAVRDAGDPRLLDAALRAGAVRWVPIPDMHTFGPVWDGHAWWEACVERLERTA